MLPEYFKKYKAYVQQCFSEIELVAGGLEGLTNTDDLTIFQNYLIRFGENLEKEYGLYDSPLIRSLEKACELLYHCSQQPVQSEMRSQLCVQFCDSIRCLQEVADMAVKETDYHTSIVLIAKNEGRYIREWIEYHLLVGISHFYIYDNESTDGLEEILKPYIEKDIVTYRYFPGKLMQMPCYRDALKHYRLESEYLAFIDADEFIVPVKYESIPETIDRIIEHYNTHPFRVEYQIGGIAVNWRWYGSSGHKQKQDGLLLEHYTRRAENDYPRNAHVKTICNPRVVTDACDHPHSFQYQKGYYAVSEKGSYVPGAFFYDSSCELIQINHYHIKSEQEYFEKWKRGWPDHEEKARTQKEIQELFDSMLDECNAVEDRSMEKYVNAIKRRLEML